MKQHDDGVMMRDDLEHQRAVEIARSHIQQQLAKIAAIAPGHEITVETYPGRRDRYVAKAIAPTAAPYLLMTDDANELYIELASPPHTGQMIALPSGQPYAPGTRPSSDEAR